MAERHVSRSKPNTFPSGHRPPSSAAASYKHASSPAFCFPPSLPDTPSTSPPFPRSTSSTTVVRARTVSAYPSLWRRALIVFSAVRVMVDVPASAHLLTRNNAPSRIHPPLTTSISFSALYDSLTTTQPLLPWLSSCTKLSSGGECPSLADVTQGSTTQGHVGPPSTPRTS